MDTRTGIVYVADFASASVTVLDGARCNAIVTSGCRTAAREQAVGSQPTGVEVNPRTGTVCVTEPSFQSGSMSIFRSFKTDGP